MNWQRVSASAHNCSLIIVGSLPTLPILGRENWRHALIATCFAYHACFRRGCIGNYINRSRDEPPVSLRWCIFYTAGFATIFYSVFVPFDLLGLYIVAQIACLRLTGRTIPGYLTGYQPA